MCKIISGSEMLRDMDQPTIMVQQVSSEPAVKCSKLGFLQYHRRSFLVVITLFHWFLFLPNNFDHNHQQIFHHWLLLKIPKWCASMSSSNCLVNYSELFLPYSSEVLFLDHAFAYFLFFWMYLFFLQRSLSLLHKYISIGTALNQHLPDASFQSTLSFIFSSSESHCYLFPVLSVWVKPNEE